MQINGKDAVMAEVYQLFRDRSREVDEYINFVVSISEFGKKYVIDDDPHHKMDLVPINRELEKVLRANAVLLIYNLVESTLTNAIDAIHQVVEIDEVNFDNLSRNMRNISVAHFKRSVKNGHEEILDSPDSIQVAISRMGYDKMKLFSGNVDCEIVYETSKRYGFMVPDPNKKGRKIRNNLKLVKDKRNALAHGRSSFEECGQGISVDEIKKIHKESIVYLRAVLYFVMKYIRNNEYSKQAAS